MSKYPSGYIQIVQTKVSENKDNWFYRENLTLRDVWIFAIQDFSPFLEKNYPNPPG
jgi:hypothetical protein